MALSDDKILKGFQSFNPIITKKYFYDYCREAYRVLDYRYHLRNKLGLDFLSLTHEYYLSLLEHDFKPLADRPEAMRLKTFMFKGLWYLVQNTLKAHKLEFNANIAGDADDILKYVRSSDYEEGLMQQVTDAVANYYHDDKMTALAYDIFILDLQQNDISKELGMTPSAVNQRYKKMMDEVVTPFVLENYGRGLYKGAVCPTGAPIMTKELMEENTGMNSRIDKILRRTTPSNITSLKPNEIFVFGSNLRGIHAGGAARMAHQRFGAEMGNGVGRQGQSYAIPTMQGGVETIVPYVNAFITYAKEHTDLTFLVTPIGCGIAGFDFDEIAPLFKDAITIDNIHLPKRFWKELEYFM